MDNMTTHKKNRAPRRSSLPVLTRTTQLYTKVTNAMRHEITTEDPTTRYEMRHQVVLRPYPSLTSPRHEAAVRWAPLSSQLATSNRIGIPSAQASNLFVDLVIAHPHPYDARWYRTLFFAASFPH